MDMGKSVNVQPQQSTAKQKSCAYFLGYTVDPWDKIAPQYDTSGCGYHTKFAIKGFLLSKNKEL